MKHKEIRNAQGKVVGLEARLDDDMRKSVIAPACSPEGRDARETYRVLGRRSTCHLPIDGGRMSIHRGPYITMWQTDHPATHPDYIGVHDPRYNPLGSTPTYMAREWVVTRHDEDKNEFEILLRTANKEEAQRFFDGLEDGYPESDLHPPKHGGARKGAGHPVVLGASKLMTIDMPLELLDRLDQVIQHRRERGEKVSRNELIREFVSQGIGHKIS